MNARTADRLLRARARAEKAGVKYDDACADYAELIRDVESTTTLQAIADVLGCTRQRVHQIARGYGGLVRPGRPGRRRT